MFDLSKLDLRMFAAVPSSSDEKIPANRLLILSLFLCWLLGSFFLWRTAFHDRCQLDELWRLSAVQNTGLANLLIPRKPVTLIEIGLGNLLLKTLGTSCLYLRLIPIFFASASAALMIYLSSRIFMPTIAVLVSAMYVFSPGLLLHVNIFRPYTADCFLILLCITGCYLAEQNEKYWRYVFWLSLSLTILSPHIFPFLAILVLVSYLKFKEKFPKENILLHPLSIVIFVFGGAFFCNWCFVVMYRTFADGRWSKKHSLHILSTTKDATNLFAHHLSLYTNQYLSGAFLSVKDKGYLATGIFLVPVITSIYAVQKKDLLGLLFLYIVSLQLALSLLGIYPMFFRTSAFCSPLLILLLGYPIQALWLRFFAPFSLGKEIAGILLIVILLFSREHRSAVNEQYFFNDQSFQKLTEVSKPGDLALLSFPAVRALMFFDIEDLVAATIVPMHPTASAKGYMFIETIEEKLREIQNSGASQTVHVLWLNYPIAYNFRKMSAVLKSLSTNGIELVGESRGINSYLASVRVDSKLSNPGQPPQQEIPDERSPEGSQLFLE